MINRERAREILMEKKHSADRDYRLLLITLAQYESRMCEAMSQYYNDIGIAYVEAPHDEK